MSGHLQDHRQAYGGILVVVCDQYSPPDPRRRDCRSDGRRDQTGAGDRNLQNEFASLPQPRTPRLDGAAMQFDEAVHQRKTDPQAPFRTGRGAFDLGKHSENSLQGFCRNADSIVLYGQ